MNLTPTSRRVEAIGKIRGAILGRKEMGSGADKRNKDRREAYATQWEPCNLPEDTAGGSTPSQYGLPDGAKELQDLIEYREMNFAVGNIFKAAYRLGKCDHSDRMRDLRKIQWFVERELNYGVKEG